MSIQKTIYPIKPWYLSRTIWASLITLFISIVTLLGFDVAFIDQKELMDKIFNIIIGIAGLVGIFGRIYAKKIIG